MVFYECDVSGGDDDTSCGMSRRSLLLNFHPQPIFASSPYLRFFSLWHKISTFTCLMRSAVQDFTSCICFLSFHVVRIAILPWKPPFDLHVWHKCCIVLTSVKMLSWQYCMTAFRSNCAWMDSLENSWPWEKLWWLTHSNIVSIDR